MCDNKKMLAQEWANIEKRVVKPLWYSKYKQTYEALKLDYDDFVSLAGFELNKAILSFDPSKSNLFTFATNVIKRKTMTELRDCTQRDVRKTLHLSESVDALDRSIIEKIPYYSNCVDVISLYENDLSEKMISYLKRLSNLQKQILFLMSEGFDGTEIQAKLKITEKDFSNALNGIRAYRNVSILF